MPSKLWEALTRAGNSVAEQVAQLYGTGRAGRPDTRAAAAELGVSQRTVERWIAAGRTPDRGAGRRLAQQHETWRQTPQGQQGATIGQQVAHLYGTNAQGRPDTRAAAQALGVSQRTVQRWITANRTPATASAVQLADQHQTWRDTAPGRQGQIPAGRAEQLGRRGAAVRFRGRITISRDSKERTTTVVLSGPEMAGIITAGQNGDDALANQLLEDAFSNAFGGSVSLNPIDIHIGE